MSPENLYIIIYSFNLLSDIVRLLGGNLGFVNRTFDGKVLHLHHSTLRSRLDEVRSYFNPLDGVRDIIEVWEV